MRTVVSLTAFAVAIIAWHEPMAAQGPRREPPIRIPGTNVVLEDGWTLVLTDGVDYRCMYAVPTSWVVTPHGWRAADPRGVAGIEVSALDDAQWTARRAAVQAAMPSASLREDTSRRFRTEQIEGARAWEYVAERDGAHVCAGNIETRRADRLQDVVQKIASTVHVAHESDWRWTRKP